MKLYFSPGACSLSPHIVLREAGFSFTLEKVDLRAGKYSGGDFKKVNPKGYVPALELDNGEVLTEGSAIVQYLADKKPESGLLPALGTLDRYRCLEWLNFVATELHKAFGPLWAPDFPEDQKKKTLERVTQRLELVNSSLNGRDFLLGKKLSIADAYLFTVLSWSDHLGISLQAWPNLVAFQARMNERPKVQEALQAEKLTS